MMRKNLLANGEIYHIFTRSIADYIIFNNDTDFERMRQLIRYYRVSNDVKFSNFFDLLIVQKQGFDRACDIMTADKVKLVQVVAYCLMPTHIHLVLKQLTKKGISTYLNNILNSYTRFFNTQHGRKGPLWESRFKSVVVNNNEQLQHLIRYVHLNAATARLVEKPDDWPFSSYNEYLGHVEADLVMCQFDDIFKIQPKLYRKFVNNQISYQRELAKIKNLMIE